MAASRIMRWAITLSSYQYRIQFRPTDKHTNADMCSRFPLTDINEELVTLFMSLLGAVAYAMMTRLDVVAGIPPISCLTFEGGPLKSKEQSRGRGAPIFQK